MTHFAATALVTAATLLLQFCAADVPDDATDAARAVDADAGGVPSDGGSEDVPDAGILGPPPAGESDEYFAGLATDSAESRATCLDGFDNDTDGVFDCADASCQRNVQSCCVGVNSVDCCGEGPTLGLPIAACPGDLAVCASATDLAFFGEASPRVATEVDDAEASLSLNGDLVDTGLARPEPLDPRAGTISVEARIAMPPGEPSGVDAMGVALIDYALDPEQLARVVPVAGLLLTRNRQRVTLVVSGEPMLSWPAPTDGALHTYRVTLAAGGRIEASLDGVALLARPMQTPWTTGLLRAVVYGRATNRPAGTLPTRLTSLGVSTTRCDIPGALLAGPGPLVPAPSSTPAGWAAGRVLGAPSVVSFQGQVIMALEIDDAIYLAERRSDGFHLLSAPNEPLLAEGRAAFADEGVGEPSLSVAADGQLELWFTGHHDDVGSLGRIRAASVAELLTAAPQMVLTPTGEFGLKSVDQASVHVHNEVTYAALREELDDGSHRLALWQLSPTPSRLTVLTSPHPADPLAFDRDAVASPALLVAGGVFRVYYAGQRGTRWSIGLLISDDIQSFRETDLVVLGPTGVGFDALGARDPSPVLLDGALHLYYTGGDGLRSQIGGAIGLAP